MNDNPPNYVVGGYTPPPQKKLFCGGKKNTSRFGMDDKKIKKLFSVIKKYPPNYLVGGYKKKNKSFGGGHKKYSPPLKKKKVVSCCVCGRQVCIGHKKDPRVSGLKKTPEVMTIYGTQKKTPSFGGFLPFFFSGVKPPNFGEKKKTLIGTPYLWDVNVLDFIGCEPVAQKFLCSFPKPAADEFWPPCWRIGGGACSQ